MEKLTLDYSGISLPSTGVVSDDWEPPIHKYFGKKLPNGKMEKEPPYNYVEFPRSMYGKAKEDGGRIVVRDVHTTEEKERLISMGWALTPAAFGYIGAPSFEEHLRLQKSPAAFDAPALVDPRQVAIDEAAERLAAEKAEFEAMKAEFAKSKEDTEKRGPGRPAKVKEE